MSSLPAHNAAMLEKVLDDELIAHLPPLLDKSKPAEQQQRKNRSRAFSAFAIANICEIGKPDAAKAVVDDFDDYGVDAIYYFAPAETMYIVQSKLKAAETFSEEEALAFCQGVRKLIKQDFSGFNKNVQDRRVEIEDALDNCSKIRLVIAHTGSGISLHARKAIDNLLGDEDHGEERLDKKIVDYDAARVVTDLRAGKAYDKVNADLWVQKCATVNEPRITYFGLVQLEDLVRLHEKHGKALYERNIRTFLGHKTEVNTSIRQTLADNPKDFVYLNNGVTALCEEIEPKGVKQEKGSRKRLRLRGLSVINGAQTIASSAKFLADNAGSDISAARVSLTLIKAGADSEFGKVVTRARNHQNPVLFSNFAALDDEQERLRRELAYFDYHYSYKAEANDGASDPKRIRIDEAAQALAMLLPDPRYVVWLKKEPAQLLDTTSERYKLLFPSTLTAFQLVNAVLLYRYIQARVATEGWRAVGQERLAYKHGNYAIAWVFAKRLRAACVGAALIDSKKMEVTLSAPFDQLRQLHWDKTKTLLTFKGPLALFRNQADVVPFLKALSIAHYDLSADPAIEAKAKLQKAGQAYAEDLFAYVVQKAPQIGGLT